MRRAGGSGSANLVDTTQSVLSGAGAARSTYGGCVGATGQDYTVRVTIWTAPGGIADPDALTAISMINGCMGGLMLDRGARVLLEPRPVRRGFG